MESIRGSGRISSTPDRRPRWRHATRGTVYVEIGRGCFQTANPVAEYLDLQEVVLYQAESGGQVWVRPTYEFMDGRFERVEPPWYRATHRLLAQPVRLLERVSPGACRVEFADGSIRLVDADEMVSIEAAARADSR